MGLLGGLAKFIVGGVVGAAAGAAAAAVLAPQSGDELKKRVRDRLDDARVARVQAEADTAATLRQQFREAVEDSDALRAES